LCGIVTWSSSLLGEPFSHLRPGLPESPSFLDFSCPFASQRQLLCLSFAWIFFFFFPLQLLRFFCLCEGRTCFCMLASSFSFFFSLLCCQCIFYLVFLLSQHVAGAVAVWPPFALFTNRSSPPPCSWGSLGVGPHGVGRGIAPPPWSPCFSFL